MVPKWSQHGLRRPLGRQVASRRHLEPLRAPFWTPSWEPERSQHGANLDLEIRDNVGTSVFLALEAVWRPLWHRCGSHFGTMFGLANRLRELLGTRLPLMLLCGSFSCLRGVEHASTYYCSLALSFASFVCWRGCPRPWKILISPQYLQYFDDFG